MEPLGAPGAVVDTLHGLYGATSQGEGRTVVCLSECWAQPAQNRKGRGDDAWAEDMSIVLGEKPVVIGACAQVEWRLGALFLEQQPEALVRPCR